MRPLKVMYIDGVGPFGGASRSLFEAVNALPAGTVEPHFLMAEGTAADFYRKVATDMVTMRGLTRFDNTEYSHYRGLRWLVLLREISHIPSMFMSLWKARRRWPQIDLIHVNEITELLPGLLAKRLFGVPLVVHVRSPQRIDSSSWRTRCINATLQREAAAVIAINENTRATLPDSLAVDVIQNSFTPKAAPQPDPVMMGQLDKLRSAALKVGFIGNLHHGKGLFDLLEATKIVRASGRDIEVVVAGGVARADRGIKAWLLARSGLAQDVHAQLVEQIAQHGLQASFHLVGATTDIQRVYERLDVLCFPSHYDAPGRPVFEAAFSAVPCIVSVQNPRADTLVHGETGLAIPARDPAALAAAISHFADDRTEVRRMGAQAKALAEKNFVPATNAQRLLALYRRVMGQPQAQPAPAAPRNSIDRSSP